VEHASTCRRTVGDKAKTRRNHMKLKKNRRKTRLRRWWSRRRRENWEEERKQKERANWSELVPEMAFVLLACAAVRERSPIRDIAGKSVAIYPRSFKIDFCGRKIPDYSLVLLTLIEGKKRDWGYFAGNWFKGWRLTKKGAAFARDVQRRREARLREGF
jgi:hypothetical protein